MPRRARLAIAGVPWHIIQRGNNRSVCFFTNSDYIYFLDLLFEQGGKHGCLIHAYSGFDDQSHSSAGYPTKERQRKFSHEAPGSTLYPIR